MKRLLILLAAMAIVLPACTNDNNKTPTTPTISVEEITAKVTEFLDAGESSFSVDFTPGTQTEMHAVVISLISEAKTEKQKFSAFRFPFSVYFCIFVALRAKS